MATSSVPEAAERLGVSPARVRQRIDAGSLIAEKIGGRWLVDLESTQPAPARAGRPIAPASVWWSIRIAERARAAGPFRDVLELRGAMKSASGSAADDWARGGRHGEVEQLSRSSRDRAVRRVAEVAARRDHDALFAWLNSRASRHLYVAAQGDLVNLRADRRLVISGVSHPASAMEDPRVVEGYVDPHDLEGLVAGHWLERPMLDERPNVVVHASPVRPAEIGPLLLAADLFEHQGVREMVRAHELLDEWLDALLLPDGEGPLR